jgi:hypothetical protein
VGSFRLVVGDTQLDLVANVYKSLELLYYYGCVEDAIAFCIHHFYQWYVSLCYINYYSCVYLLVCFFCAVFVQASIALHEYSTEKT